MKTLTMKLILLIMAFSLSGCIRTAVEVTPESMKGKGLLVAHVSVSGYGLSKFFKYSAVKISGERYRAGMVDGYVRIPLLPGTYDFESLNTTIGSYHRTLPIKGEFTIKAGEVTTLGEIFLLFQQRGGSRYNMIYLDNNDDMHAYLRSEYSNVYGSLKKKFNKADVKFIEEKYVGKVRRQAIAQTTFLNFNKQIFTGPLGSIGISERDKKGKVTGIKWVKTGTLQEINNCDITNKKVACVVPHKTKGDSIFYAQGKKYNFSKKPKYFSKGRLKLVKDDSLLWISPSLDIYRSRDKGKHWKRNRQSNSAGLNQSSKRAGATGGKNGLYVYSRDNSSVILYNKYKTDNFINIDPPERGTAIKAIAETSKGLYVGPEWTLFTDSSLHFKANGKNEWTKRVVPSSNCSTLWTKDHKKDEVRVSCSGGGYIASDEGAVMVKFKPKAKK